MIGIEIVMINIIIYLMRNMIRSNLGAQPTPQAVPNFQMGTNCNYRFEISQHSSFNDKRKKFQARSDNAVATPRQYKIAPENGPTISDAFLKIDDTFLTPISILLKQSGNTANIRVCSDKDINGNCFPFYVQSCYVNSIPVFPATIVCGSTWITIYKGADLSYGLTLSDNESRPITFPNQLIIPIGTSYTIGRGIGNSLMCPFDKHMSERHLMLRNAGGNLSVENISKFETWYECSGGIDDIITTSKPFVFRAGTKHYIRVRIIAEQASMPGGTIKTG